jgi:hypothetical protein
MWLPDLVNGIILIPLKDPLINKTVLNFSGGDKKPPVETGRFD